MPGLWYVGAAWYSTLQVAPDIGYMKEFRAGEYKDKCYGSATTGGECSQFYRQQIHYSSTSNASCPFDGNVCVEGPQAAFRASTGPTDVRVLGVNAPASDRFNFARTMTCALVMNHDQYMRHYWDDTFKGWGYFYRSGGGRYVDQTAERPGFPIAASMGSAPTYQVLTDMFIPNNLYDDSPLLPEFKARKNTVSLIFLSSHNQIVYQTPRKDPIFPANSPMEATWSRPPPDSSPSKAFWVYDSTRPGVLGCVDSIQICNLAGSLCWDQGNLSTAFARTTKCDTSPSSGDAECAGAFAIDLTSTQRDVLYLLRTALRSSTASFSISRRGGSGLEIAKRFGTSVNLLEEQWKFEAESLFQTSLARMQLDLYDFAMGTYADMEGAKNLADADFNDASKLLMLPESGHKNIDRLWLVGINVFCFLVYLSSRRYSTSERRRDKLANGEDGGYHENLWGTIALKKLGDLASWLWRGIVQGLRGYQELHTGISCDRFTCNK